MFGLKHGLVPGGLPLRAGILVVGVIPAVALWSLGIEIRIATDFTGVPIVSLPLLILNVGYLIGASQLIRTRIIRLRDYTRMLGGGPCEAMLNGLTDVRAITLLWAVLLALSSVFFDPVVFGLHYSVTQSVLRLVVTGYLRLVQASFLWVLGYSMFSIYSMGNLPIRLKSFTEDRSLGLSVYGRASLLFVTLYVVAVLLTFPFFVYVSTAALVGQMIFFMLGLVMFAWPLLGLRGKLLKTKGEKLAWIQTRHKRAIELIESSEDGPIDPALVNELIAIDSIRRDVQQIHTWPFNPGVLVRLVTVVVVPLTVVILETYVAHLLSI